MPIRFGEAVTRAAITDAEEITEFKVYAEMNLGPDNATDGSNQQWVSLFDGGEKVYRDNNNDGVTDTTGDFTYNNTRYWVNDRTFNFFAVHPYETEVVVSNNGDSSDAYSIQFETPESADMDFLYASVTQETEADQEAYQTVNFELKHITSKIKFEITRDGNNNQNDRFWIKSITLSNIKKSGTVTVAPANTDTQVSWTYGDAPINFKKEYSEYFEIGVQGDPNASADMCTPWNDGLLLMPQNVEARKIELKIAYQYQLEGANADETKRGEVENREIITSIPAIEWKSNTSYCYKLQLKETNLITFSQIEVAGWGSNITGGTIIIK